MEFHEICQSVDILAKETNLMKFFPRLLTQLYERIDEGALKKVDEFGKSDESDEISPRLLTELYEWTDVTWLEGPQKVDEFGRRKWRFWFLDRSDKMACFTGHVFIHTCN